ncbi:MAG: lytic transglycosylase domain-containing protein [Ferruginibacter sp.]
MKKLFCISLTIFFLQHVNAGTAMQNMQQQPTTQKEDTVKENIVEEDAIIEDIIQTKKTPQKEKVQYISQLTKYGFKNLFKGFSYNPSLPYSSQVNPFAENYMQDYLRDHANSLEKMKTWGQPYFNLIDNIFAQYGLPRELKYLAVIESNLNTGATSWVGAGGPWQFMPYTARDYGLLVNRDYDERRDYIKSTHAAARYLLTLYRQMHDWLLVIAAYNGGPGKVYDAMKKSGSKDFWTLQYYLPLESRNHVKKFIATHYVMEAASGTVFTGNSKNFFSPVGDGNPYAGKPALTAVEMEQAETQTISGKYNSLVIAKNLGIDIAQFNRYNPEFDNKLSLNGQYDLRLPSDKMQLFLATKYQILNECVQLLLGDPDIPNNKTVYPTKPVKKKKG